MSARDVDPTKIAGSQRRPVEASVSLFPEAQSWEELLQQSV